jgi:restriction endonuclease Mrr
VLARWLQHPPTSPTPGDRQRPASAATDDRQLLLPFALHVKTTYVQLVDITSTLSAKILANPAELFELSPPQFEELVLDRLSVMGLHARPVGGGTYRRDGGIDIIFTPPRTFPFPFIGAVQVKHRRNPSNKVGPEPLRELMGVMAAQRVFAAGMIVTNTGFTPDAKDFASRSQSLLRLRDFHALMRWVADNFLDDAEWRELPTLVQLCEGVSIDLS